MTGVVAVRVRSGRQRTLIMRVAVATAVAAAGFYAASQSLAMAVRTTANDLAFRLAPWDARILSLRTKILTEGTTDTARWERAAQLARKALLRDPLSEAATATVGLNAAMQGNDAVTAHALGYAQQISRRDLRTNLWAIEYRVLRNDIPGALHNYDVALRTSKQAPDILFPILAGAVSEAPVRMALLDTLSRHPVWGVPFLRYAAETAPNHRAAALLFGDMRRRGIVLPQGAEASLLGALVADRDYTTARAYLVQIGIPIDRSRHSGFAGNPATPSPFDWNPLDDSGVNATIQQDGNAAVLVFSTTGGAGGPVLRQLQLLPAGRYAVISALTLLEPAGTLPYWTVQCVDGGELARFPVAQPAPNTVSVTNGSFTVPDNCPAQWWTLNVPSDDGTGVNGEMRYAAIRPAGAAR